MIRIPLALLTLILGSTALGAQTGIPAAHDTAPIPVANTLQPPMLDPRLVVRTAEEDAASARESQAWRDVVTRPWWHYPAIGAAIGGAAGAIHVYAITRSDYYGAPVDPRYILPPAYALAGAFLGILIDSAERERAARR